VAEAGGLRDWLRLTLVPGVGGETRRQLLKTFGLPGAAFAAAPARLRAAIGADATDHLLGHNCRDEVLQALDWAGQAGNRILTLADAEYPQALLNTVDPPVLLYLKGKAELLNRPAIAVVGSRNASKQGELDAEAFAKALADAGLTVISGLALGIDAAAHRGALKGTGSTVAVVGTGADRIYPAGNQSLAREIADRGAIVSEFPLGTPPLPANFPRRNRLIAGLSRGCLVVEAAERSGSLITARLAAEAGLEVFALPGSIHSPLAKGCHKLLKQGAKLVESAQDILEELRWEGVVAPTVTVNRPPDDPAAVRLLDNLGYNPCDLDTLTSRSGLTTEKVLALLLPLELDGYVTQLPGGRYQRIPQRLA
jgi:DNA processing protein